MQVATKSLLVTKFFPISEQGNNIKVPLRVKVFELKQAFNYLTVIELFFL